MSVENELKDINKKLELHEIADDKRFADILNKLEANHEIHIRNEEILKQILEQTKRTNGRCTSLESNVVEMQKSNALLNQIVSQQHGQYEKFVVQQEKLTDGEATKYVTKEEFRPVKGFVYGLITLILSGVGIALIALVVNTK